jgi:hypothetical protein
MVASILPEDESCVLPNELEKKRLNAVVTNLLCSCVCSELKLVILTSKGISKDAHLIWKLLFGIAHMKWDEVESDDDNEPVEMCPTTSTTTTDHETPTLKEEGDKRSEGRVSLGEAVQLPPTEKPQPSMVKALVLWPRRKARRRGRPRVQRVKRSKI